jgi:hypothetical protein
MNSKFFVILAALLAVSFVLAAKEPAAPNDTQAKNITYGQCVSAAADVRNTCYDNAETQRQSCMDAQNESKGNACNNDYKKVKGQCKQDFKATKKTCAQTYKPGFFEKLRYAFK